jgi:aerotaxis receptor
VSRSPIRKPSGPDDVYIYSRTDLKGRITEDNPAFAQISGYPAEEMLGKSHNLVRHPDMPREAFADLWRNLQKDAHGKGWSKTAAAMEAFTG